MIFTSKGLRERWRDIFITSSGGLAWTNENVNLCFDICLIGPSLLCVHWNQTKRLIQIIRIIGPWLVDTFRHGSWDMHRHMSAHFLYKSKFNKFQLMELFPQTLWLSDLLMIRLNSVFCNLCVGAELACLL